MRVRCDPVKPKVVFKKAAKNVVYKTTIYPDKVGLFTYAYAW